MCLKESRRSWRSCRDDGGLCILIETWLALVNLVD